MAIRSRFATSEFFAWVSRAPSPAVAVGSRVADGAWAIAVGGLAVVMVYDLATLLTPAGEPGWGGAIASVAAAACAGSIAGWLVVHLRGGVTALVVLALMVVLGSLLSAQVLASVGRGYASWAALDGATPAWGVRWAGLVSAGFVGLVGWRRLQGELDRGTSTTGRDPVSKTTAPG